MDRWILYHGSSKIISLPDPEGKAAFNDFGGGFYLTESREAAGQWACGLGRDGFINRYELTLKGLKVLDLGSEEYSILNWLALVMSHRKFRVSEASFALGLDYILENFSVDISGYDVIKGNRADEIYFFFSRAFLSGKISLGQFKDLMKLGPLGEQTVLKSRKAFEALSFVSLEGADAVYSYPKKKSRNDDALATYYAAVDFGDEKGLYIGDILREEVREGDERIR